MLSLKKVVLGSSAPLHGVPRNKSSTLGWGMSETSPLGLLTPINDIVEGSCGVLVPNTECKITDVSSGENLPPHKTGELCLRGPQVMKSYLDNPKATDETIKDGWLHSGDIAYYDEGGNIFIVDRLKELIKVKGFQVLVYWCYKTT